MPSAFQKESLGPINSQRTFSQLVEYRGNAPTFYLIIYIWRQEEEYHATCDTDGHAIEGYSQITPISNEITPIENLNGNHVRREPSRPKRKHTTES